MAEQMAKLNLDSHQPKFGQDPAVFNEMYMNYISHLQSDAVSDAGSASSVPSQVSERPYSQQSSQHGAHANDR